MTSEGQQDFQPDVSLVVDATLRDAGNPAPQPGFVYIVSLMRYEILDVVDGEYPDSSIFVGHHSPNLMGPEFRVGASHRLRLTREFPRYATILDKFQTELSTTKPFFCVSFEVLEPRTR